MRIALLSLALASTVTAQNAVILGNATTYGGHAQGSVFVQGNWQGSSYEIYGPTVGNQSLYVGGSNLTNGNYFRVNSGTADIRGSYGSNFQGSKATGATPDFSSYASLGQRLAALGGTSINSAITTPNNVTIALQSGLNVFSLTENLNHLEWGKTIGFTGASDAVVLINVYGSTVNWGTSVNFNAANIVWNFVDATAVNINGRDITGSVIATNATVTQNRNIDGTLVAKDWVVNNHTELHNYSINGTILAAAYSNEAIPEPSALVLCAAGAAGMLFHRRRK